VSGKVNSADKLYLVIESVKRDAKHSPQPPLRLEWGGAGAKRRTNQSRQGKKMLDNAAPSVAPANAFVSFKDCSRLSGSPQTGDSGSLLNRR